MQCVFVFLQCNVICSEYIDCWEPEKYYYLCLKGCNPTPLPALSKRYVHHLGIGTHYDTPKTKKKVASRNQSETSYIPLLP